MHITCIIMALISCFSYADSYLTDTISDKIESVRVSPVQTLSVLYDQAYTGVIDTAVRCDGLYLGAEDFLLTEAGRIEGI